MTERPQIPNANSEEINEIVTAVPSWILRWGITLIFSILTGIILLSAIVEYPDVVHTNLKINSLNSPKVILAKSNGKLISLLIKDGQMVRPNQDLAFLESTANAKDVIILNKRLKIFRENVLKSDSFSDVLPNELNLGELQGAYQNFFQQYLQYQSTLKNGYFQNSLTFLYKDLKDIKRLQKQIETQREIQKLEYRNKEVEYKAYQKLYQDKVISRSEFAEQENIYLASKYPLQQTEASLLNNASTFTSKEKEQLDLRHKIAEEKANFIQSLNQCITESETWLLHHVVKSPIYGRVTFAGIIEENQNVSVDQELFIVNPGNLDFFGEIQIPQYNMGNIRIGEKTLVKLKSYPYEQYGMIRGRLTYISEVAYHDSLFIAKVSFDHIENQNLHRKIILKNGMQASAEIITEESSLLKRLFRNLNKVLN